MLGTFPCVGAQHAATNSRSGTCTSLGPQPQPVMADNDRRFHCEIRALDIHAPAVITEPGAFLYSSCQGHTQTQKYCRLAAAMKVLVRHLFHVYSLAGWTTCGCCLTWQGAWQPVISPGTLKVASHLETVTNYESLGALMLREHTRGAATIPKGHPAQLQAISTRILMIKH